MPKLICAEVNEIFRNWCRSSPVPKFDCPKLSVLVLKELAPRKKLEDLVILGGVLLGRWLHNETLLDIESNCIENTKNRIW